MQPLIADHIQAALSPAVQQQLQAIQVFTCLDSTNRYALALPPEHAPLACLAEYQTAGRGQHGRVWLSPYGSGLCLSCKYAYPRGLATDLTGLNLALAIAAAQTLQTLGVNDIGLKWPNDIVWNSRKLAGLLLETRRLNGYQDVVIGIGINVQTTPLQMNAVQQPWVDLATCLAPAMPLPNRNDLAAALIEAFITVLQHYPQQGFAAYQAQWQQLDTLAGKRVSLIQATPLAQQHPHVVEGIVQGIDATGGLLIDVAGQQQSYRAGEVSVRDALTH